jgi:hypothetical protein
MVSNLKLGHPHRIILAIGLIADQDVHHVFMLSYVILL